MGSIQQNPHDNELGAAKVWELLSWIPSDDRQTWVKAGMAAHGALGDAGFALWDSWSQSAGSYCPRAARDVWKSFKPGKVGPGTLVHLAKQHGWRPDRPVERSTPLPPPRPAPKPDKRDTALYAAELWIAADCTDAAVGAHPYAVAKGITWAAGAGRAAASGRVIGRAADCLVVPVRNIQTGKLQAVQCINAEGAKQTFGPVRGGCLLLGNTLELHRFPWYVAEGWASAVSMVFHHMHGDGVCAAAFGKSNMEAVAHALAEAYGPEEIIILKERD